MNQWCTVERGSRHDRHADRRPSTDGDQWRCERAGGVMRPTVTSDRISEDGIRALVDEFYTKVRADPVLAPIFERAIAGEWVSHLATMHDFWSSVMLTSGRYKGNPVAVHLQIEGVEPQLFARWLELFDETCIELFDDKVAGVFRAKAVRIAQSLKLALFYRPDSARPRSAQ
jgi:hemoglobin